MSPVTYDEGLCSYKAIVFIAAKYNPNCLSIETVSYLQLGVILQKTFLSKQEAFRGFFKTSGVKLWIK